MTGWIRRLHPRTTVVLAATAAVLGTAGLALADSTWTNPAPITINDVADCGGMSCDEPPASATAYPSTVEITDEDSNLMKVTVTLHQLSHTFPDDIDILLVGPQGQSVILMSDAGGDPDINQELLTFDDAASQVLPDSTPEIQHGTYRPTNYASEPVCLGGGVQGTTDVFNAPAPAGPYGSTLSVFNGTNPNGIWSLYIVDDCHLDSGTIINGWSLQLNAAVTAVNVATFAARAATGRIELGWRTRSESEVLGYNVLRFGSGRAMQVNGGLIRAKATGRARGAAYRLVDKHVSPGVSYTYRLQVVALDGSRSWGASTSLRAS